MCVGPGSHGTVVPVPWMGDALVRGSQYTLENSPSWRYQLQKRDSFFTIDGNDSDFQNPQFLAECFLEQNLNDKFRSIPLNVPNQTDCI